jgi:hypothetical protein
LPSWGLVLNTNTSSGPVPVPVPGGYFPSPTTSQVYAVDAQSYYCGFGGPTLFSGGGTYALVNGTSLPVPYTIIP